MDRKNDMNKMIVFSVNKEKKPFNHANILQNQTKACLKIDDQLYNALTSSSYINEQEQIKQQLPRLTNQRYSIVQHNIVKKKPHLKTMKRYNTKFWSNIVQQAHHEKKNTQICEFQSSSFFQKKQADNKSANKMLNINSYLILSYIDEDSHKLDNSVQLFKKNFQKKRKNLGTIREVEKMRRSMIAKSLQIIRKRN